LVHFLTRRTCRRLGCKYPIAISNAYRFNIIRKALLDELRQEPGAHVYNCSLYIVVIENVTEIDTTALTERIMRDLEKREGDE